MAVGSTAAAPGGQPPVDEARAAVQALLAASKAQNLDAGAAVDGGETHKGLRALFRAEFQEALKPRPTSAKLAADLEAQVAKLLAPPPRRAPAAAPASAGNLGAGEEVHLSDEEDEADVSIEVCAEPHGDAPRRKLVVEDGAESLREQVADARHLLFDLDKQVTKLTRQLRESRQNSWKLQQQHSAAESRIFRALSERSAELDGVQVQEGRRLESEEKTLRELLGEWRAKASRHYSDARHQDGILQQERDAQKGGDAHRVLAKHPAGEVFFPSIPSDNESDDGYYRDNMGPPSSQRSPRGPARDGGYGARAPGRAGEEDDDGGGGGPLGGPSAPSAPPPPLRSAAPGAVGIAAAGGAGGLDDDVSDRYDSDSSDLPSPSGGSGSPSQSKSQSESRSHSRSQSASGATLEDKSVEDPLGGGRARLLPAAPAGRGPVAGLSDSDSDGDEFLATRKLAAPKAAPVPAANPAPPAGAAAATQPPAATNTAAAAAAPAAAAAVVATGQMGGPEDEAEEVSSEEIDEIMESSRSL